MKVSILLVHFDEEVRQRFAHYGESIPAALSKMDFWLWELTKLRLRSRATFNEMKRSFVLDKSPYQDLRLSRITFGMDRSLPPGERYHLGHPLARRILADCQEGAFTPGRLTLTAGGGYAVGLSGEIGLWRTGMISEVAVLAEPILCGVTAGGIPLSHDDCAGLLQLEPLVHDGGPEWKAGEGETWRGRKWRDATPRQSDVHQQLRNQRLDALRNEAFAAIRDRLALDHNDEMLQAELSRLRQWAEDEGAALKER